MLKTWLKKLRTENLSLKIKLRNIEQTQQNAKKQNEELKTVVKRLQEEQFSYSNLIKKPNTFKYLCGLSIEQFNRWVHTSLVSRPQVYFNLTSDMNGSNSNLSSLLCSRGNVSCSKEPKYTSKSSSTHPYRRTYALSKQFQEIECQSNALFDEISEHTRLVRHAHYFRTTCYGTSFVDLAEAKLFFVYVACFVVHSGIYLTEKHGFFV